MEQQDKKLKEEVNKRKQERFWIHPDDKPLQSSASDMQMFINNSSVWGDMKMTIEDRMDILTESLLYSDDVERMKELRTELRTLKQMLELPQYLAECIKREQNG